MYSGYCRPHARLRVRGCHPLWLAFPKPFPCLAWLLLQSEPRGARTTVWAPPVPLAATPGITFVFSSSGYLDVSVRRVPLHALCVHAWIHGVPPCGSPHSDTRGSLGMCPSPRLFAACRVFHRLLVPRHPPCALSCLASSTGPARALPRGYVASQPSGRILRGMDSHPRLPLQSLSAFFMSLGLFSDVLII